MGGKEIMSDAEEYAKENLVELCCELAEMDQKGSITWKGGHLPKIQRLAFMLEPLMRSGSYRFACQIVAGLAILEVVRASKEKET